MGIRVGITRQRRRKRANNAGSVYRYPDGRWVARISAGRDPQGRRIRKTVYAQTQAEAQARLIELQARYQSGSLAIQRGRMPTLKTFLSDWLGRRESLRPRRQLRVPRMVQRIPDSFFCVEDGWLLQEICVELGILPLAG